MTAILDKFNDGGTLIMYPILILLIIILALIVKAFMNKGDNTKTISLISSLGWFTIAWGYLGRTIGMIKAFDNIAASGEVTPKLLSGGIKMAILGPLFGIVVFLIARLGMIVLIWIKKEKQD